jgi:hypothetical protein
MLLKLVSMDQKGNLSKWSIFRILFFSSVTHIFCSDHHRDPDEVSITSYGSLVFFRKNQCMHKICWWHSNSCFTLEGQICDEISWRGGNFVTCKNELFLGPRWLLRQKSLNSYLGPEFRQRLKETKYEAPLKSFGEKNYFVLKVWRN